MDDISVIERNLERASAILVLKEVSQCYKIVAEKIFKCITILVKIIEKIGKHGCFSPSGNLLLYSLEDNEEFIIVDSSTFENLINFQQKKRF